MPTEIERKFLIKPDLWKDIHPKKSVDIKQAYLSILPEKTIRVRVQGKKGFITIKGKTTGISRTEYEYNIPLKEALEIIAKFPENLIEKTRHYVLFSGNVWEVDQFKGTNQGLLIAEIELKSEDQKFKLPPWIDKEVTNDKRYYNSNLSQNPIIDL